MEFQGFMHHTAFMPASVQQSVVHCMYTIKFISRCDIKCARHRRAVCLNNVWYFIVF
jgi:hypothetical protein